MILENINDLSGWIGKKLGTSPWMYIDQEMVDTFAKVTHDEQYIHVDPVRAAAESPYGRTIAHGFFVLSLASKFVHEVYRVTSLKTAINYGLNRVRFPHPTGVGDYIRGHVQLLSCSPNKSGTKIVTELKIEIKGVEKPACVTELVALLFE